VEASLQHSEADLAALRAFRDDFWLWATACVNTVDENEADRRKRLCKPFPRYDYLRQIAAALTSGRNVIVLKPRQMFASWLVTAYAVHRALFNPGERILVVSKREKDAWHLKQRADAILANLAPAISDVLDTRTEDNKGTIEFTGGSALHFLPASPSIGRTYTATVVILDELAFHPHADEMFTSLQPTLAGGGQCIALSTPNGVGGLFHELWSHAEERDFLPVRLNWNEHPHRDSEWYEKAVKPLGKRKAAQEYDCDFLQSGAVVFEAKHLSLSAARMTDEQRTQAIKTAYKQRVDSPFLIGVDVAEGSEDGDFSVASVLEKATGRQCETLRGQWRPDVFARKLKELADKYPGHVGVEKAGPGGTVILELERLGIADRLYRHREWDERGRKRVRFGWVTSTKSKPVMIEELEIALRNGDIRLSDKATADELLVYEWKDSASEHSGAPEGYHDDCVIALSIAWQMRKGYLGVKSVG